MYLSEFISMLWVIILHEYKSLTYKLSSRLDHVMLQYAMIAGLIQFALLLVKIRDFAIGNPTHMRARAHHNRPSSNSAIEASFTVFSAQ